MSYLTTNDERLVLRSVIEDPKTLDFRPWWFSNKTAEAIAWGLYYANKQYKEININNVYDLIDTKKSKASKEDVDHYLNIQLPDPETMKWVNEYFKLKSQLFELREKQLETDCLSDIEYTALRKISQKVKDEQWTPKIVEVVDKLWHRCSGTKQNRQAKMADVRKKLTNRFE